MSQHYRQHPSFGNAKTCSCKGSTLIGRLILLDALNFKFRELKLQKDPECSACGERPTITELIDYEAFCGVGASPAYEGPWLVLLIAGVLPEQSPLHFQVLVRRALRHVYE